MEENRPRRSRPEMGTPEYEEWRKCMLERRRKRLQRERRNRLIAIGAVILLVAGGISVGVTAFKEKNTAVSQQKKSASATKESNKTENQKNLQDESSKQNVLTEAAASEETVSGDTLAKADLLAQQYNYDKAIDLLKNDPDYGSSQKMQNAVKKYEETKATCTAWPLEEVTHVFYHILIKDTSKAFDGDYKEADYNQVMTTIDEFNKITQTMYEKGYVMVSIKDMAKVDENGNITEGEILLPPGKTPFVLSQDDVCYYHSQDGDGIATKLVIDEEGKVRNEYVQDDGSTVVGDYDVVPLIDRFVEEHPDFAYHGHKGIVALTGYNGILGYRTDISYQTRPDDLNDDKKAWLDAHPDFDLDTERAEAKKVADAMKAEGWTFASHTWGHKNMSTVSMERLETDTQNFKENIDPLIGGTDIIIFAFGADINNGGEYTGNEKFEYLKSQGYDYYCNVDSNKYFVQMTDEYFRMGRRNVDGYRMYYNPDMLADLFDVSQVFDPSRPTPVPPMNGG